MATEQRSRVTREPRATTEVLTMRAIVQDEYGEAGDVLRLERVERPAIGDGEVLVRVHAAGVDRGVWHVMAGLPYPIRLAGFGVRAPKARVRGREVAGRVEAVGKDVTDLRPGDEVFGIAEGSFAEYARADRRKLVLKPANLTFEQAAAVSISALTALQAVRDRGGVRSGQRVMVIGAAGGVGSFAVQLATSLGAEVTGVCRTAKLDLVRSLGADHVIDHTTTEITAHGRHDVIIDTGGNRPLSLLRRALTPRGTLVIVGAETGGRWFGGMGRLVTTPLLSLFTRQRLRTILASETARDLTTLAELAAAGTITPAIDRTYPLAETAKAIQDLQEGRILGKAVITLTPSTEVPGP